MVFAWVLLVPLGRFTWFLLRLCPFYLEVEPIILCLQFKIVQINLPKIIWLVFYLGYLPKVNILNITLRMMGLTLRFHIAVKHIKIYRFLSLLYLKLLNRSLLNKSKIIFTSLLFNFDIQNIINLKVYNFWSVFLFDTSGKLRVFFLLKWRIGKFAFILRLRYHRLKLVKLDRFIIVLGNLRGTIWLKHIELNQRNWGFLVMLLNNLQREYILVLMKDC